jgi:hypothetical protein
MRVVATGVTGASGSRHSAMCHLPARAGPTKSKVFNRSLDTKSVAREEGRTEELASARAWLLCRRRCLGRHGAVRHGICIWGRLHGVVAPAHPRSSLAFSTTTGEGWTRGHAYLRCLSDSLVILRRATDPSARICDRRAVPLMTMTSLGKGNATVSDKKQGIESLQCYVFTQLLLARARLRNRWRRRSWRKGSRWLIATRQRAYVGVVSRGQ